jgi:hypothetical protein
MPEKVSKLMPALYGGILMGVISGIPYLNFINTPCFCCAGVLFGGFMAVFFYKKDLPADGPQLTSGDGVQLGALAGVFGAITGVVTTEGLSLIVGNINGEIMYNMIMRIYDSAGILDKIPPDAVQQMKDRLLEGGFSIGQFFVGLAVDVVFGLLGGLIGYAVFKPKATVVPPTAPAA